MFFGTVYRGFTGYHRRRPYLLKTRIAFGEHEHPISVQEAHFSQGKVAGCNLSESKHGGNRRTASDLQNETCKKMCDPS